MKPTLSTLTGATFIACLFALFTAGCSQTHPPEDRSSTLEWSAPRYTNLEVYINQYTLSPTQGATSRPDLTLWRPDVKGTITTSTHAQGKPPYRARLEYKGTSPAGDHYTVTLTHPVDGGSNTIVKDVVYHGDDAELFRDDEYRIGVRPRSDNDA